MALLFHAGKLGVALIDDQIDESVAHLLRRHLAEVFPLAAAFEGAKLNFVSLDRAIKRIEFEVGNLVVIDADIFSPIVEHPDPITKSSDFCDFTWHNLIPLNTSVNDGRRTSSPGLHRNNSISLLIPPGAFQRTPPGLPSR